MYSAMFDYYRPKDLKSAIALLRKHKGAKILAGGHSLLPAMKLRVASPPALIDIGRVKGLDGIKVTKKAIQIGAMTTHATIAGSREVKERCPLLAEAASQIGDIQVRNRGTIGGSLAHADPAADYPTIVLALGGKIVATGSAGKRQIPVEKFHRDLFTTALKPNEVLTAVQVPALESGTGSAYQKHRHPASSYAVVGVAAVVTLRNGVCSDVRLVVGGAVPSPMKMPEAADVLLGEKPTGESIAAAASKVREAIREPIGDVYASEEYRTHLAAVLTERALTRAAAGAKGGR